MPTAEHNRNPETPLTGRRGERELIRTRPSQSSRFVEESCSPVLNVVKVSRLKTHLRKCLSAANKVEIIQMDSVKDINT